MNTRKITTYAVVVLSILIANLLQAVILSWLPDLEHWGNPYTSTAIRMGIMVIVFTPVFALLDQYVKNAAKVYVRTSKHIVGSSLYGTLIGIGLAILLIFIAFLLIWYQVNIVKDLF